MQGEAKRDFIKQRFLIGSFRFRLHLFYEGAAAQTIGSKPDEIFRIPKGSDPAAALIFTEGAR